MIIEICDRCGCREENMYTYALPIKQKMEIRCCGELIHTYYKDNPIPIGRQLCRKCASRLADLYEDTKED